MPQCSAARDPIRFLHRRVICVFASPLGSRALIAVNCDGCEQLEEELAVRQLLAMLIKVALHCRCQLSRRHPPWVAGVVVIKTIAGSPAVRAGMQDIDIVRNRLGDIIVGIHGASIFQKDDLMLLH